MGLVSDQCHQALQIHLPHPQSPVTASKVSQYGYVAAYDAASMTDNLQDC